MLNDNTVINITVTICWLLLGYPQAFERNKAFAAVVHLWKFPHEIEYP